jgi:hypothetical protein
MTSLTTRTACALMWLLVTACGTESEPKPAPEMEIQLLDPVPIGQSRYRVAAQITNFDPTANLHGELIVTTLGDVYVSKTFPLDAVTGPDIAFETETLDALTLHQSTITLMYDNPQNRRLRDQREWHTGPPEITAGLPATLTDVAKVTITGFGLRSMNTLRLGFRPTPGADEILRDMDGFFCEPTQCTGQVPILLSPPPERSHLFSGAVPPATVHLGHRTFEGMVTDAVIGTTQLVYIMSIPRPSSGPAGSEFEVQLFHPARAPDLAGVTVSFDDMALTPVSVTENFGVTSFDVIYLTVVRFRVPATATPGTYRLRAVTQFGEEMKTGDQGFTVTPP